MPKQKTVGKEKNKKGTITAIVSHKGGCGKTASTVMLAALLSSRGDKVLVVDVDSNCSITKRLLTSEQIEKTNNFFDLMTRPNKYSWSDCIVVSEKYKNVAVMPASMELAGDITPTFSKISLGAPQKALIQLFRGVENHFDHILFDCFNGISMLNQAVICLADRYITPTDDTLDGLSGIVTIRLLAKGLGLDEKKFLGALVCGEPITAVDKKEFSSALKPFIQEGKKNKAGEIVEEEGPLKNKILAPRIPFTKMVSKFGNLGLSMLDKRKTHPVTKAYEKIIHNYF